MTTQKVTSAAELQAKIEAKRYAYFTFPVLDITIKYRKPDVLKLALNKSLPSMLASMVIKAYKANLEGNQIETVEQLREEKMEANDDFLEQLESKGYVLLKELCVSHKIYDVPESDFVNNVISWNDIPEEDAMSFLINLINKAQVAESPAGGEMSANDIVEFPAGGRGTKRGIAGKNR